MEIETAVICIACVVVSALVIYLTSHFAIKERSFDEVMEEQRKRNNIDTVFKSNVQKQKAEKAKKEKKDKSKKSVKKGKEKEASADSASNGDAERSKKETPKIEAVTEKEEVNVKREHNAKVEHVDFKEPEVIEIILDDEQKETILRNRKMSTGSDKSPKPILVVKPEVAAKMEQQDSKLDVEVKFQKRNSFEILKPKDELELVKGKKHNQEKDKAPKIVKQNEAAAPATVTSKSVANNAESVKVATINGTLFEESVQSSEDPKVVKSSSSNQKSKKKSTSNATLNQGSNSEVPSKRILQQINSNSLTNDEIQLLINALLNKQSDGSSEWMKKNDPIDALKKQLREKDQLLEAEKHNSQAAMARMKELRQELDQEKAKEKVERERDIQSLHNRYHQQQLMIQEQHRNEIKALQAKVQHMQTKLTDEHMALQRVQEEKSRLQQALQQSEAERANYESISPHLKHEVEQLRAERQQYERRQLAMQQSNDDLHRQVQQLEEHLKTLANAKQKDEFSFQQKLNELSSQHQQVEASKASLVDELQQKCKECNNLESENISWKKKVDEVLEEKQKEMEQFNDKINQLNNERKAFEETLIAKEKLLLEHKNCNNFDKEAELKQLSLDLNKCKEELTNAKNEIETQKKKNDDLREKNWEAIEALSNVEKQMNSKIASAVSSAEQKFAESLAKEVEARQKLEETLHTTEEKYQQLVNERTHLVSNLSALLPTKSDNVLQSLQTLFDELHQHRNSTKNSEIANSFLKEIENLKDQLLEKESNVVKLQFLVDKYKVTLTQTENMLKRLEDQIVNEESQWKRKLEEKENECYRLAIEKRALEEKCEQNNSL